jgi:hypothetical protein
MSKSRSERPLTPTGLRPTTFRWSPEDEADIQTIKERYGYKTDIAAVRLAIKLLANPERFGTSLRPLAAPPDSPASSPNSS